jgi:hypothetical protein
VNEKMRRRQFLAYLTVLGGGAGALLVLVHRDRRKRSVALQLETLLGNEDGVAEIGRAYLRLEPTENEIQLLSDRIFSEIRWDLLQSGGVREVIARRVREDFRQGRVVRLQGWVVSRTEARLCALVALAHPG